MSAFHHDQPLPGATQDANGSSASVVCVRCGRPLSSGHLELGCLVCLLTDAFSEGEADHASALDLAAADGRFGDFTLEREADGSPRELGHGAMGTTYLARDTVLDRPVALKVINSAAVVRAGAHARFLREAKGAAALRHPNVAGIFQYGVREADGQPYYAMELIEGETLEERVRRDGPLPAALALEIAAQVARALGAAEARGLVHRDLKPSNVMLTTGGGDAGHTGEPHVKVIDFGLAKTVLAATTAGLGASQTAGGFVGTPAFASPEQFAGVSADPGQENGTDLARGGALDVRSDIFSLGVTLWFLLTGTVPFAGRTLAEIHARQTRHPLPVEGLAKAGVPARVVTLLRSLLAPDPAARPQNARELAAALRDCRQSLANPVTRRAWAFGGAAALVAGLVLALALVLNHRASLPASSSPPAVPVPVPDKSVAVLPFSNLGGDPANAFLADGIQDEILTDLARVADLKVISRTSVMAYRDAARLNVRDIGRDLGVAYVLEGSVAREGGQVRVTAQLIDARTDAHVWAERYDRPVDSLFAIEDEVAGQIAARLQIRLTADERSAMNEPPTTDLAAYELYLRAREIMANFQDSKDQRENLLNAVRLLAETTTRDPGFHRAWCLLTRANCFLYHYGFDATPPRLDRARAALAQAVRLRPDAGETHYEAALLAAWAERDFPRAERELALARRALPNHAPSLWLAGILAFRQNLWDEGIRDMEGSFALDPRNEVPLYDLESRLLNLRRYPEQRRVCERGLALNQQPFYWQMRRGLGLLYERADPAALRAQFAPLPPGAEPFEEATGTRFTFLCWTRDFAGAARLLDGAPRTILSDGGVEVPHAWSRALLAHYQGDAAGARPFLEAAHTAEETRAAGQAGNPTTLMALARIDALRGRKDDALREARAACEKWPAPTNAYSSVPLLADLALVESWTGETDAALSHLAESVRLPYGPSYGDLRLNPDWDALRGDPRFEALCRKLAPGPQGGATRR